MVIFSYCHFSKKQREMMAKTTLSLEYGLVALAVRQHVLLVCLTFNHPFFLALVIVFLMCLKKSQKGRKKKGEETNWALFWWDCFSLKPYQCPRGFRRRCNR